VSVLGAPAPSQGDALSEIEPIRLVLRRVSVIAAFGMALVGCSPTNQGSATVNDLSAGLAESEPETPSSSRRLRLVSEDQYINTIASMFGRDVLPNVGFAPFRRTDGLLAISAGVEAANDSQVELYHRAATYVAEAIVAPERRNFLIPCKPADPAAADNACAAKFMSYVGRRLFRRPLTDERLSEAVQQAAGAADKLDDFYAGLSLALEGLLASPKALYIDETTEPDPQHPGTYRLDSYSLASRLSYFLWNMAPDDALLDTAARGELHRPEQLVRIVDAMLASDKLDMGVRAFFDDMLSLDNFSTLSKDPQVYPAFTGLAVADAREQTLRMLVDHLVTKHRDYRDVFVSRDVIVSKSLAPLYGLRSPTAWVDYELPPETARVGLVTQVGFLALHSHPGRSSPTLRGKALRELLLCQKVPPPPANVDFSALENPTAAMPTTRDRVNFHLQNPVCAGCHKITDPIGLALEHFDGAGQYRETERGRAIDASGSLDGKNFKDAGGLGQALREHPAVPSCLVRRMYSYALGASMPKEQDPLLKYFEGAFAAQGYKMPELMRTIALSKAFVQVAKPADSIQAGISIESARISSGN